MVNYFVVVCATGLLAVLLYCEKKEALKAKLVVKTVLSSLFILTAVIQPHPIVPYFRLIILGLIFCLTGDVFLALPGDNMFRFGLAAFLLGHMLYVSAFLYLARMNQWTVIGLVTGIFAIGAVYMWLRSHLGSMKIPVILYMIVITAMVVGAWTVLAESELRISGRILIFIGALSFYFSDIFVARQRFLKPEFINRLIGLPLYYCGQFMLAFSIGWISRL